VGGGGPGGEKGERVRGGGVRFGGVDGHGEVGFGAQVEASVGEDTAVPMALLVVAGAALSMIGLLVLARPTRKPAT
jgi:hypothetical protein